MSESFYPIDLEFEANDLYSSALAIREVINAGSSWCPDNEIRNLLARAEDLRWECGQEIARIQTIIAGISSGPKELDQFATRMNEVERAIATVQSAQDLLSELQ